MTTKTRLLTALWIIWTTMIWTAIAFNMPDLIDKMNEQKITYQVEQETLKETNDILREEKTKLNEKIALIDTQITENSKKWEQLNGKIEQVDTTIKMIETWELGK